MDRKSIRHERRKKYFIKAAMELLREGDETQLTAKNIAEKAGYSAASLYDYFDNLDHLIIMSVDEYMAEIGESMDSEMNKCERVTDEIKAAYLVYSRYFLDNPALFKTIFMTGTAKARFSSDPTLMPKFHKMGMERLEALEEFEKEMSLQSGEALKIEHILTPNMFGVLYMYYFGMYEFSKEEIISLMERNIELVLKPFRKLEDDIPRK